jgi:hypothetical protein
MRQFAVIVRHKRKWLKYPLLDGQRACRLLQTMQQRGREAYAVTTANGITETLELKEMLLVVLGPESPSESFEGAAG